jgi:Arc/MetJ-type ribon-helix-helix transcriptional regulator
MDENDRITLRLEQKNLELIDEFLASNPNYKNRSQLCRDAVQAFIESVTQGGNTVQIRVPRYYLDLIDHLVANGYFLSREHAIVRAIEEWFDRERVKEITEHRQEIDKTTGKVMPVSSGGQDGVIPP